MNEFSCKKCEYIESKTNPFEHFSTGCSADCCGFLTDNGVDMKDSLVVFMGNCPLSHLDKEIEYNKLKTKTANLLKISEYNTIRDLVVIQGHELLKIPKFGRTAFNHVIDYLAKLRLEFAMKFR